MTHRMNIAVVGGGFAGLTSALELSSHGYKVDLYFDPMENPAASHAAQGVSTIKGLLESDQELFALKMKGHSQFLTWLGSLETIVGQSVDKILGVYEPFYSLNDFQDRQARIYKSRFLGAFAVTTSGPRFEHDIACNFYSQDFWVDCRQYLGLLKTACELRGVKFVNSKVIRAESRLNGVSILLSENVRPLSYDALVLAAGAGIAKIAGLQYIEQSELKGAPGSTFVGTLKNEIAKSNCAIVNKLNAITLCKNRVFLGSVNGKTLTLDESNVLNEKDISSFNQGRDFEKTPQELMEEMMVPSKMEIDGWQKLWGIRVRNRARTPMVKWIDRYNRIILNTGYYKNGLTLTPWGASMVLGLLREQQ